jgi:HAD superfamily hydrolase (TIGR01484 family)
MLHYGGNSRKARMFMENIPTFQQLDRFEFPARKAVRIVLADIDDTLTTDGRLTAEAYTAMERLENAGILVAPVTGRPAGWCDQIARMWPVAGVIGENGAFYYRYDRAARRMRRVYAQDAAIRRANRETLDRLAREILEAVPGAAVSADQFARDTDLAIDFCEDVAALPPAEIARIVALFEDAGAVAKVSSIHVNGWFGTHDKLTMAKRFLTETLSIDPEAQNRAVAFIGDSPNDAPMWSYFENGVAVANARRFKGQLSAEPRYVTRQEAGAGFVEFAEALIDAVK